MTSLADGRSRFPRRRGQLLLLLLLLLFVYKPRPPAVLPVITRESLLCGTRAGSPRGGRRGRRRRFVFIFFRHCGPVALLLPPRPVPPPPCRVVPYPFMFLLLFSSCVDVVGLLSTGVLIKKPVHRRFTGITSAAVILVCVFVDV